MGSRYPLGLMLGNTIVPSTSFFTLFAVTEICVMLVFVGEHLLLKRVMLTYGVPVGKFENEAFVTLRHGMTRVCETVVSFCP